MMQASKGKCSPYFIWILEDLFYPLGGFLNFIVYSLTKKSPDVKEGRELIDKSTENYYK